MYTGGNWIDSNGMCMPPHLHPDNLALTAPRRPTQDVVARRFAEQQAGKLRYCHDAAAWFVYDGQVWRRDRAGLVLQRVREIARDLATNRKGEVYQPAGRRAFLEGAEHLARSEPGLAVTAAAWPDHPHLLGTPEGPVDLASGLRREPEPGLGLQRATIVAPSRDAQCPTWTRFLHDACGESDEVHLTGFLQRFLGYALSGSVAEQSMLYLHGPGGTGKTVFLNTVLHVMAEYAAPAPLSLLTTDRDRHARDLAALRGLRLVAVAESERGRRWDERRLKLLTGGDAVTTGTGSYTPTFKLIVTGNQPPRLDLVDAAVRRRLCIVPFVRAPRTPDRDLAAKLSAEAPGILRWMIEGAVAWHRDGLGRCSAVEAATAEYFAGQDVIGQVLAERCDGAPGDRRKGSPAGDLFKAWCDWADEIGEPAGPQRAFAEALAARGYARGRNEHFRFYRGLDLKAEPPLTADG